MTTSLGETMSFVALVAGGVMKAADVVVQKGLMRIDTA